MFFAYISLAAAAAGIASLMLWVFLDPDVRHLKEKKRRRFERVANGTGQHLVTVPSSPNAAGTTPTLANTAGSWPIGHAQAGSNEARELVH